MRMVDILAKKRDGSKLTREEIVYFIHGYVAGEIPDYQASALLMAAFIQGLDDEETVWLTEAMAHSGDMADLSMLGTVADKHSTGGVADTTTLVAVPLMAACGLKVGKMSGRGLGHTGGTLDKLESIPGMTTSLTMEDFIAQVRKVGAAVMGQTLKLCPADKLLYALRDVTATVESIPLIASSIMSKKLASGANVIMLDVKTGNGAFMADPKDAHALAEAMVRIGNMSGRRTAAIISDMSQPLGNAVGNTLEVIEAVEILQGQYEGDLLIVSMELASRMLCLAGLAQTQDEARAQLKDALRSGRALKKLAEIVDAQGGDPRVTEDSSRMPAAPIITTVVANRSGVVSAFDCRGLGLAAGALGAGRQTKDDVIDLRVGFVLKKRVGDVVQVGEPFFEVHASSEQKADEARQTLLDCVTISESAKKPTLIYGTVE